MAKEFKLTTKYAAIIAIIAVVFVVFFATSGQTAKFYSALQAPSRSPIPLISYQINEIYIDGATTSANCGNGASDGLSFSSGTSVCYHVKITALNTQNPIMVKPVTLKVFEHAQGAQSCTGTLIDSMVLSTSSGTTSTFVGNAFVNAAPGTYYWDACISNTPSGHTTWYTSTGLGIPAKMRT